MEIEVVRRVCVARHLYELAQQSQKSSNELYLFSATNLLQDSVEVFFLALCDHIGVALDSRNTFDKYFVQINDKISPKELPFKSQLLRLNRIRVDSKHYGLQPDRKEVARLSVSVGEFFQEACAAVLGESFSTLSVIDLLNEGETRNVLLAAKSALDAGELDVCAINCRKAIYLEIERRYSVYDFRSGAKPRGVFGAFSSAPFYARNAKYIADNVKTPTDYICLDHAEVDRELAKHSVDNTGFWNVWRLTPSVFRDNDDRWFIERNFTKLDHETLSDNIQYIFDTAVNIVLSMHTVRNTFKSTKSKQFHLELVREETPVYEKADRASTVAGTTPKGLTHINCTYYVDGLNDDGIYWNVMHIEKGLFLTGFVHNDDLQEPDESEEFAGGLVKWFDPGRGFGFIVGDDGQEIFVHKSAVKDELDRLVEKQRVVYRVEAADKGPTAVDVRCQDK